MRGSQESRNMHKMPVDSALVLAFAKVCMCVTSSPEEHLDLQGRKPQLNIV